MTKIISGMVEGRLKRCVDIVKNTESLYSYSYQNAVLTGYLLALGELGCISDDEHTQIKNRFYNDTLGYVKMP